LIVWEQVFINVSRKLKFGVGNLKFEIINRGIEIREVKKRGGGENKIRGGGKEKHKETCEKMKLFYLNLKMHNHKDRLFGKNIVNLKENVNANVSHDKENVVNEAFEKKEVRVSP